MITMFLQDPNYICKDNLPIETAQKILDATNTGYEIQVEEYCGTYPDKDTSN